MAEASSVASHGSVAPSYQTYFREVPPEVLSACAELFSTQYGIWSRRDEHVSKLQTFKLKPGTPVKMSAERLKSLLFDDHCAVVVARVGERIVGHAFFTTFPSPAGLVRWITQLVVHEEMRGKRIATLLLMHVLGGDKPYAMALVSSHPAAVRALEGATFVRCTPAVNQRIAAGVLQACTVPYLKGNLASLSANCCLVDTAFFVDHANVLELLAKERKNNADDPDRAWQLGELPEGHEFLALVELRKASPPRSPPKPAQ